MRLVEIEWLDAHGDGGGWMMTEEITPKMKACSTVGYVVAEDDDYICVVQTHGLDGQYYNHMCVPKGMIVNIVDRETGWAKKEPTVTTS
jgi:hypothetical protein